jgi:hypothetical protein
VICFFYSRKNNMQLSSAIKKRLRLALPIDIYTHKMLPYHDRTVEHVFPRSLLPPRARHDPIHLFITSSRMNSVRGARRFGEEIGLFYPPRGHRLIAHTAWRMLHDYPDLEEEDFFSPQTLDRWLRMEWGCIEKWMYDRHRENSARSTPSKWM